MLRTSMVLHVTRALDGCSRQQRILNAVVLNLRRTTCLSLFWTTKYAHVSVLYTMPKRRAKTGTDFSPPRKKASIENRHQRLVGKQTDSFNAAVFDNKLDVLEETCEKITSHKVPVERSGSQSSSQVLHAVCFGTDGMMEATREEYQQVKPLEPGELRAMSLSPVHVTQDSASNSSVTLDDSGIESSPGEFLKRPKVPGIALMPRNRFPQPTFDRTMSTTTTGIQNPSTHTSSGDSNASGVKDSETLKTQTDRSVFQAHDAQQGRSAEAATSFDCVSMRTKLKQEEPIHSHLPITSSDKGRSSTKPDTSSCKVVPGSAVDVSMKRTTRPSSADHNKPYAASVKSSVKPPSGGKVLSAQKKSTRTQAVADCRKGSSQVDSSGQGKSAKVDTHSSTPQPVDASASRPSAKLSHHLKQSASASPVPAKSAKPVSEKQPTMQRPSSGRVQTASSPISGASSKGKNTASLPRFVPSQSTKNVQASTPVSACTKVESVTRPQRISSASKQASPKKNSDRTCKSAESASHTRSTGMSSTAACHSDGTPTGFSESESFSEQKASSKSKVKSDTEVSKRHESGSPKSKLEKVQIRSSSSSASALRPSSTQPSRHLKQSTSAVSVPAESPRSELSAERESKNIGVKAEGSISAKLGPQSKQLRHGLELKQKGKQTILPAHVLSQVVVIVQENVRTISTEVVGSNSTDKASDDAGTTGNQSNNTAEVTYHIAPVSSSIKGETDQDDASTVSASKRLSESQSASASAKKKSKLNKKSKHKKEAVSEEEHRELLGVLPQYVPESDSCDHIAPVSSSIKGETDQGDASTVSASKKLSGSQSASAPAKKKSKLNKKSKHKKEAVSEEERRELLGVLPQYVPESDGRLKKQKIGKVYNLSALFSGNFGEQSEERPKRPNYFAAIQITNQEIKEAVQGVLTSVEKNNVKVKPAFIPVDLLHLTMAVMHLPDEDAVKKAMAALVNCRQQHQSETEDLTIDQSLTFSLSGIGHFRSQVVFAKVAEGPALERLTRIAETLRACLVEQEIACVEKTFTPHITIMKMSKNPKLLKKGGVKKIAEELYKESLMLEFGQQTAGTLQLCAMNKAKKNNYYHIEYEVSLNTTEGYLAGSDVPIVAGEGACIQEDVAGEGVQSWEDVPAAVGEGMGKLENNSVAAVEGMCSQEDVPVGAGEGIDVPITAGSRIHVGEDVPVPAVKGMYCQGDVPDADIEGMDMQGDIAARTGLCLQEDVSVTAKEEMYTQKEVHVDVFEVPSTVLNREKTFGIDETVSESETPRSEGNLSPTTEMQSVSNKVPSTSSNVSCAEREIPSSISEVPSSENDRVLPVTIEEPEQVSESSEEAASSIMDSVSNVPCPEREKEVTSEVEAGDVTAVPHSTEK